MAHSIATGGARAARAGRRRTQRVVLGLFIVALAAIGIFAAVLRGGFLIELRGKGVFPAPGSFDAGYAEWPWLTVAHIVPGMLFLALAPLQFVRRIRSRHLAVHRRSGRLLVGLGALIGVTALVMGFVLGFGGPLETSANTIFGAFFLYALGRAFYHVRRGEIAEHREWMIRMFAIALAITTMRPLVGLFFALTDWEFGRILGVVFWLAFLLHAAAAELWIRSTRPRRVGNG